MNKQITIVCTEAVKSKILEAFENRCPFSHYTEQCGEDARCDECVKDNVSFQIVEP